MRSMTKLTAIILAILATSHAYATGWGGQVNVRSYYVNQSGYVVFTTSNNSNLDSCPDPTHLLLDNKQPNFALLFATLTIVMLQSQAVQLYYNGCQEGNPVIGAIAVPNTW